MGDFDTYSSTKTSKRLYISNADFVLEIIDKNKEKLPKTLFAKTGSSAEMLV